MNTDFQNAMSERDDRPLRGPKAPTAVKAREKAGGTKLVVISMDAMITEDLANVAQLPAFSAFLLSAACVERVRSIYPTLTYPCHTTMITGVYPDRHGVTANEPFLPGTLPLPWNFCHDVVRCRDLFDICREHGLTTASVGWPVTGNHPSVDWIVDEIWTVGREWTADSMRETLLAAGTSAELFDSAVAPHIPLRVPRRQPESSFFNVNVGCEILRRYRPDVLTIHTGNFDAYRHKKGVFSDLTLRAARESDEMLRRITEALAENGDAACNIVVTSDHGHMDCARTIHPNVFLRENGLISVDGGGNVADWKAWCLSMGMSAQVHLRDPEDGALKERVRALFQRLCAEGVWGFSRVYTAEETEREERLSGGEGGFSFVLETDNYTKFGNNWTGPYIEPAPLQLTSNRVGSHGFHPSKGPCPVFLGAGPAFRKGARLETARLVDEAPTFAAVLGLEMPDVDGRVLRELLA